MDPITYMICALLALGAWLLVLVRFLTAEKAVSRPMDPDDDFVLWIFSILFALTWPVTIPLGILFACLYWVSMAPEQEA
jgi:hypothetical protein